MSQILFQLIFHAQPRKKPSVHFHLPPEKQLVHIRQHNYLCQLFIGFFEIPVILFQRNGLTQNFEHILHGELICRMKNTADYAADFREIQAGKGKFENDFSKRRLMAFLKQPENSWKLIPPAKFFQSRIRCSDQGFLVFSSDVFTQHPLQPFGGF